MLKMYNFAKKLWEKNELFPQITFEINTRVPYKFCPTANLSDDKVAVSFKLRLTIY